VHASGQDGSAALRGGAGRGQPTAVTTCGQKLTVPGDYYLEGDLGPCSAEGVTITASHVRFDLGGFKISGPGCGPDQAIGVGIAEGVSDVEVAGGAIARFAFGVWVAASNSRVHGVTLTDGCIGAVVLGGDNTVDANVVTRHSQAGIYSASTARNLTVHSNYVAHSDCGICLDVETATVDGVTVRSNIVKRNASTGIAVGGRGATVEGNVATRNGAGIRVFGGAIRVVGNLVHSNRHEGIDVQAPGPGVSVVRNSAWGNGMADLCDDSPRCEARRWRRNRFATDWMFEASDGGPGTGCIR
jgi:hypothetical protein